MVVSPKEIKTLDETSLETTTKESKSQSIISQFHSSQIKLKGTPYYAQPT